MSVSSWGRIFPSVCGGKRGITVDRGVGRSFGTVAFSSLTSGSGAFAGRGAECLFYEPIQGFDTGCAQCLIDF